MPLLFIAVLTYVLTYLPSCLLYFNIYYPQTIISYIRQFCCVLTEMASGDSGTASDSSNIGSTYSSLVGGETGSLAGPAVSEQSAALGANTTGGTAGNAT